MRRGNARLFDRLADGELSPAEERTLLAALDDEPGAWRACALALLESQTWRRELSSAQAARDTQLRGLDRETATVALGAFAGRERRTASSRSGISVYTATLGVAAALVCLAFLVGWLAGRAGGRESHRSIADWRGAGQAQVRQSAPPVHRGASRPIAPATGPAALAEAPGTASGRALVRLTLAGTDVGAQRVELPVRVATGVDPEWLLNRTSAVPSEAVDAWRRAGNIVTQSEEIWQIDLDDGHQVLVPVEQVEIDYAPDKNLF